MIEKKNFWVSGWSFAAAMWLLSRLVISIAMLLIATSIPALPAGNPALPGGTVPKVGWEIFLRFDSDWYRKIVTSGYEYADDGKQHSLAFFPLFPLAIRAVMSIGLPFEVAGTLVNNLAFLGALIVLYAWVEERHGRNAARWATAALAWCPLSIFGTVIYTEGLFLFLSTAALRAFDKQQHLQAALWGALATTTRPTGVALIPAFLITSWRERRPLIAYATSLAVGGGLFLFSLYCWINFADPLAFFKAQRGWRPSLGFDRQGWFNILKHMFLGIENWHYGSITSAWTPLLFLLVIGTSYLLWRFRKQLGSAAVEYSFGVFLGLFLLLLVSNPLIDTLIMLGGGCLLWYLRAKLSQVTVIYGFCGLGLILSSGASWSIGRIAYGIVSIAIALGLLFDRYPRCGYPIMGFFSFLLGSMAVRLAQGMWSG